MCGIAGLVKLADDIPVDRAELEAMATSLRHRGPDASGVLEMGPAGFAHTRLSIIDLEGGRQPMATRDGLHVVVFNGEIFNHVELRRELEARGHTFDTRSDTEVLLRAYVEFGADCVQRFNGQWAFAIWDVARRRLFASRDRAGVRPFYYTLDPHAFAFASEAKALFSRPGAERALDPVGLDQVFTLWTTIPPRTVFRGVRELPAGHSLVLEDGRVRTWRYWTIRYGPPFDTRSEDELADELHALLVDAIRLRLERSDVPVGAYLSGGLDSTIVAAALRNYTDSPLRTFSIAFEDAAFDESGFQAQVVSHLGLDHRKLVCPSAEIGRVFPAVVWHAEQPLVRTAPAPMYLLSGLVRDNGYKVVLTGEGADELFGGYDIFKEDKVRRFCAAQPGSNLRPKLLRKLYPYLPGLQRQSDAYLRAFFRARPEDLADPFFSHRPRFTTTERIKRFYAPAFRAGLDGQDVYRALADDLPEDYESWHPFCRAQHAEFHNLLPGYLLSSQGDRQALAHGVEGRYPYLDYRVIELAARLPPRLKMKALDEKYLLKRAFRKLLPPFLASRPKQPYRAPDSASFFDRASARARFDYVDEALSADALRRAGVFDPAAVAKLSAKARAGEIAGAGDGMSLVAVLSTQLVYLQFVERSMEVTS